MKPFELDPQNPIDRELKKTADDAATDGSLDQDDIDAQDDLMGGDAGMGDDDPLGGPDNAPEEPMAGTAEPEPEPPTKPVDDALMSRLQSHDYIQKYDHSDPNAKSHPVAIMGLEMDGLSQLRNRLRVFLDQTGVADRVGLYDDPKMKAAQDQLAFVDQIMAFKKFKAKDQAPNKGKAPRVRQQKESNVKPGQKFKARKY